MKPTILTLSIFVALSTAACGGSENPGERERGNDTITAMSHVSAGDAHCVRQGSAFSVGEVVEDLTCTAGGAFRPNVEVCLREGVPFANGAEVDATVCAFGKDLEPTWVAIDRQCRVDGRAFAAEHPLCAPPQTISAVRALQCSASAAAPRSADCAAHRFHLAAPSAR